MRCRLLAAATGAILALLGGCGGQAPVSEAPSPQGQAPPPPPPPPPSAGATDSPVGGPGQAAGARVGPSFPDAMTEAPAWGDASPPFGLAEFLQAPPAERNAAPLYLDALFEFDSELGSVFSPEEEDRREPIARRRAEEYLRLDQAWRTDPTTVSDAKIDTWLAGYEAGFRKLALAQRRPRCVFQTGYSLISLLPHVSGARAVCRVFVYRARRDLARGDLERPIGDLQAVLRLSRDLRPRGPMICQLASLAMDNTCCQQVVPMILSSPGLRAEHCRRVLAALESHRAEALDPFSQGCRAEYIMARSILHDFQHGTGIFDPQVVEELELGSSVDSPLARIGLLLQLDYGDGPLARQRWSGLFDRRNPAASKRAGEEFQRQVGSMTPDDYVREAEALNRFYGSLLALAERTNLERLRACDEPALGEPVRGTNLAVFLEPTTEPVIQACLRHEATLRGTMCLIALRRWELEHAEAPRDLEVVVKAAGMARVPIDPYSDEPLRMAVVAGRPVVYSVGEDGRDDGGLVDWNNGRQAGDWIFRLEPGSN